MKRITTGVVVHFNDFLFFVGCKAQRLGLTIVASCFLFYSDVHFMLINSFNYTLMSNIVLCHYYLKIASYTFYYGHKSNNKKYTNNVWCILYLQIIRNLRNFALKINKNHSIMKRIFTIIIHIYILLFLYSPFVWAQDPDYLEQTEQT